MLHLDRQGSTARQTEFDRGQIKAVDVFVAADRVVHGRYARQHRGAFTGDRLQDLIEIEAWQEGQCRAYPNAERKHHAYREDVEQWQHT